MAVKKTILFFLIIILTIQSLPSQWVSLFANEAVSSNEIEQLIASNSPDEEEDPTDEFEKDSLSKMVKLTIFHIPFCDIATANQQFYCFPLIAPEAYHGEILIPPPNCAG